MGATALWFDCRSLSWEKSPSFRIRHRARWPSGPGDISAALPPYFPQGHGLPPGGLVVRGCFQNHSSAARAVENMQPREESAGRTETCRLGTQGLGASISLTRPCLLVLGCSRSPLGRFRCRGHAVGIVESCTFTFLRSFKPRPLQSPIISGHPPGLLCQARRLAHHVSAGFLHVPGAGKGRGAPRPGVPSPVCLQNQSHLDV